VNLLLKFGVVLLVAFVVLASLGLLFWARPAPVLGVDADSLAHSVDKNPPADSPCVEGPGDDWTCSFGGTRYRVEVKWTGCWNGERISGRVNNYTPQEISGCLDLQDYLRLEDALN